MKKLLLITLCMAANQFIANSQTGGGCRNAISITTGIHIVDTMIKGTATYSDFFPNPTKAKWYKYTPSQDGLLNISACGGGSDTRLFVYTGTCDTMSLFAFNDDHCTIGNNGDEVASDISKFVKAGKNYFIEWDNAWDTISFTFTLSFNANAILREMQACATAKVITPSTIKVDSLVGFAAHGDAARANWYKYTPKTNGKISISSCGIDVDTRMWVYKGDCNGLTVVAETDDECDGVNFQELAVSLQNFPVTANTPYYFEWDDTWEDNPFEFTFTFDPALATNDETLSKSIVVSPNPAHDFVDLNVNFDTQKDINIAVYNTVGQVVFSKKMDSILRGVEKFDISALKSGIYMIQIKEGTRSTNKKLVIAR